MPSYSKCESDLRICTTQERSCHGNSWHGLRIACSLLLSFMAQATSRAQEVQVDFARDIQPILESRCHRCHGAKLREAGLRLDLRRTALQGGDSGAVIVPRSPAESRLLARVSSKGDEIMPPE